MVKDVCVILLAKAISTLRVIGSKVLTRLHALKGTESSFCTSEVKVICGVLLALTAYIKVNQW